jgi:hypothetical protein
MKQLKASIQCTAILKGRELVPLRYLEVTLRTIGLTTQLLTNPTFKYYQMPRSKRNKVISLTKVNHLHMFI